MHLYDYRPFDESLIDDAARLLAARHQRDQQQQPHLSTRFVDIAVARAAIAAQWSRPWSSGSAAFDGNVLIGYLIGYMQADQFFGRAIWSRLAGHAVAAGVASDLYRDLYAAAAPHWLTWGCFDHLTLVPADPTYLEPWSLLNFGRMHAYSILPLETHTVAAAPTNLPLTIRQTRAGDADHLRAMAQLTSDQLAQAPTWALTPPENRVERPTQYAGIIEDEEATCWLAFVGDEAVGFQAWYGAEEEADAMDVPDGAIELAAAGIHKPWRGQGISRALTAHALAHAQAKGYRYAITNWRTANLVASRTWPRFGFETVMYRLHRHVDERILWNQGQSSA